jgi:hypothetical protein
MAAGGDGEGRPGKGRWKGLKTGLGIEREKGSPDTALWLNIEAGRKIVDGGKSMQTRVAVAVVAAMVEFRAGGR